ncbi:PTS system N-acetylglucosamine-specific IIA component (Glc family) [Haloactinopolyspora alba]|uniref:PTS system N-acetylglucosamine-specific IIA component (Glc family) n=1 Tax=Haloactinopolyspora alba TaxID=648780 RepID=A0A2P8DYU9_9ACTN|nr:PTS glucose transporter subunit IIA [Haloactinopolyspora alba]PSL02394.1 PTS system N-acetylglucosamine-specific IIA component (Glc family) [Haloactinopolyspora alba]
MTDASPVDVLAPVSGQVIDLADVPDPVFAGAFVGPGLAVDPRRDGRTVALAPAAGRLVKLHPHAFVVQTAGGAGVLTHLGIDTVQLDGAGFELHVAEGDEVAAGAPVVTWDPAAVERDGRSPTVPVVALDAAAEALVDRHEPGPIEAAGLLFTWTR